MHTKKTYVAFTSVPEDHITTEMGVSIQQWRAAIGRGAGKSHRKRKQRKGLAETLAEKAVQEEANQVQMHYIRRIKVLISVL